MLKIGEFGDLVCFLVLGSNPEGSHPNQLQFISRHRFKLEESIDDPGGEEERFRHESILLVHFLEPAEEHTSHMLGEVGLKMEVVAGQCGCLAEGENIGLDVGPVVLGFGQFEWRLFERGGGEW